MTILVLAEHDNQSLKSSTQHTLSAAAAFASDVHVLVAGHSCQAVADEVSALIHVDKVLLADNPVYEHHLAENISQLLFELAGSYSHLLAPATSFGKDIMPRLAALLDTAQISDIIEILDNNRYKRPIYAGNAIATVNNSAEKQILTIRTTAFAAAESSGQQAEISAIDNVIAAEKTAFVERQLTQSARPELTAAKIIISGGRGLQNAENFQMLESLADKLGAAIGASRAAVDAGFVPNDYQVGQTGKIVAPQLYIAVGISGAIQHLAGMKDSKIIVAINKDADAPIFQVADYGIVGDLFKILPELEAELA